MESLEDNSGKEAIKEPVKKDTSLVENGGDYIDKNTYVIPHPKDFSGEPFKVDGDVVEKLIIKRKRPSELMGIDIQSIGMGTIDTTIELLERSCTPHLTFDDVNNLDLPYLTIATGVFRSFFMGTQSMT